MAQLEHLKGKNADRLRRAAMLQKAQGLALPDPMIGYPKEARQEGPALQDDAGNDPSRRKVQNATAKDKVPAREASSSKDPAAEPDAAVIIEQKKLQAEAPEAEQEPSRRTTRPHDDKARACRLKSEQADEEDTIIHRVVLQFTQDHYMRAEAVAKRLGLSPDAVLKKAAKMTAITISDFVEPVETMRTGPTYRHPVSFPKGAVNTWIKKQDPLGFYTHPRSMLRPVGRKAFDRAAKMLLKQLENEKT